MDIEAFQRWHADHPYAKATEEELALTRKIKPKPDMRMRPLPKGAFQAVFHFLPIYRERMFEDLKALSAVVSSEPVDNGLLEYGSPAAVLHRLEIINQALDEHTAEMAEVFGEFASALSLPRSEPHPERTWLESVVQKARSRHGLLRYKWAIIQRWQEYHEEIQDTPVCELRPVLRRSIREFMSEAEKLRKFFLEDCIVTKLLTELVYVLDKVNAVEALGDPELSEEDFKGIFWRMGIKYPGGEDYHHSITFRQATALNLFEGNPIYAWRGHTPVPEPEEEPVGPDPALLEAQEAARKAQLEKERLEARQRAARTAADLMKQGCEVCQSHYITWVALGARDGCDAIVLCEECLSTYKETPAVYKLYTWFEIAELVDENLKF